MQRFLRNLLLVALSIMPLATSAQNTLTVADGTSNHEYVPFYGYYADEAQHNQVIYPADSLTDMNGMGITQMVFYIDQSAGNGGNTSADRLGTWTVSLGETTATTLSGIDNTTPLTQVYEGYFDCSNGTLTITFSSAYVYNGGNLLLDLNHSAASWNRWFFLGISMTGASYCYNNQRDFLPKTTFTYGNPPSCIPASALTASNVTSNSVDLSWVDDQNSGAIYTVYFWSGNDTLTETSSTTSVTLTNLNASTGYGCYVVASCSAGDEAMPSNTVSFTTDCAGGSCDITVQMTDSYGDGWNGGHLNFYQNGSLAGTAGLTSGGSGTATVSVCSGVTVTYNWSNGSYDSEVSYTILDGGNTPVYSSSTSGVNHSDSISNPCPSCLAPTALAVDSIDQNSAIISWTPRSGATLFAIYQNGELLNGSVTDTTYTFNNLTANTLYTFGVQAICTSEDSSSIATVSARTDCGAIELPYFVDFEDNAYNGAWYPCWDSVIHAGTDPSVNTVAQHNSTYGMYFQATSSEAYNLVVSPMVPTAGDNIYVRFWGYNTNTEWFKAGVMSNPHDTSTFIPLVNIVGNSWNEYEFRTDTVAGIDANTNYYIAWMAYKPGVAYNTQMGRLDDVYISEAPSCVRPSETATPFNVTAHTVDLLWSEVTGANNYIVYYGTVNDVTDENIQSVTVSDTTVTLTGLSSETHYYAWVATNCGSSESEARPFSSFTTLISCPAVTNLHVIDSLTTSDGATLVWNAGGQELQWEVVLDSNDAETVYDTVYVVSGLESMTAHTLYVRPICSSDDIGAVRSVDFATACGDATCNLTAYVTDSYNDSWNGCTIRIMQAGIQVGTIECPSGQSGSTFTYEVCSSDSVSLVFYKGSYANELGGYIQDGGGSTVFTIEDMNNHYTGDVLATIATPCPDCIMPSGLVLDTATATEATISWTAQDGQSEWAVRLDTNEAVSTTATSYTFANLDARSTHTAYVATICGNDTTPWSSIQFTTDCSTGSCDIYVSEVCQYNYSDYSVSVKVYQNGSEVTTVTNDSRYVNVCAGMPTTFIYQAPSWSYFGNTVVILDGGGDEIFNASVMDENGNSSYSTGDTLAVMENACPTCLKPTGLMASAIDSTTLEFTWNLNDTAYGYLVSFDDGTWEFINSTSGIYNASLLTPNTAYTVRVKALCTATDTSNAASLTVKTACGEMVLPYSNSFEADPQGTVPSCWTVVRPGYGNYPGVSSSYHTGSNGMTLAADYNDSTTIASSLVPLNGDQIHVSFWASVNQGNTLYAGVMTDLAYDTTFIPLLTVPYNNSTYTLYEFNTTALPSYEQYYVAFRLVTSGSNHYADLDDITIMQEQGCSYPTNINTVPGAHNISLVWSCAATTPNYVIEYHDNTSTTWTTSGTTFDTAYNVTGLNAAATYQLRIGLVCGNDTLWSYTSAQTTCDMVNLPYYENFDSPTGTLPPCWDYTNPSYFHWNRWTTHAETSGDGELMVGGGSAGEYAILPEFNSSITKIQISFKAKLGNISEGDSVLFGVYDSYSNTVTQAGAMAIAGQSRENFVVFTYAYTNYSGSGSRIAIGHSHNNPSDWGMAVDSIVVIQLPDCLPPTDVEAHNTMYPNTADDVYFTWTGNPYASSYQIYIDTITSTAVVDSVPDSLLVSVDTNYYHVPFNSLAYGAHYRFFVRSNCGYEYGEWVELQNGFATDEVWMGNGTADTVIGCDFIVYDNGGPVAGYLHNSNSTLVMMSGEEGRELQVQGGWFSHGADANTFTIYDGVGTSGDVLYQRNQTNLTESVDTILATSTTGALTITFTSGYYAALGYELYVHCVGAAPCQRPVRLHAVMTDAGEASLDWEGTANSYKLYYKLSGATTWDSMVVNANNTTLTGLTADTNYDFYVVADCDSNGLSTPSVTVQFNTHFEVVITPCDPVTDLAVNNVTTNSADLSWTSTASSWEIELSHLNTVENLTASATPYTLTNLLPNMQYSVRVRSLCNGQNEEPSSEWSTTVSFTTAGGTTPTFTITAMANDSTMGVVTGGGTYNEGSVVTLNAMPNLGYRFVQWNDADTTNPRNITVTANATYIATFEAIPVYTITATANDSTMGTVTGGGQYQEGSVVTLTATPNDGYQFVQWNDAVTDAVRTITVTTNANYVATFADTSANLVYHTVTVSVNDSAMGSVSGNGSYLEGSTATLTATPNSGYRFVEWNDNNTDNPRNVVVNEDMSFTAVFEAIPTYTITVNANPTNGGNVTGAGTYQEGTVITLVATSNSGFHFVRWNDNITDSTRQVVVNGNETYVAFFEANVGINDVTLGTVSLYPNPASTSVTLGLEGFEGEVRIDVVDISGRAVYTANTTSSTVSIDVNDMPQGAYFVRVTSGSRTAVSKLIVR